MNEQIAHDVLEDALARCGAGWDAAQAHGLLSGKLAVHGVPCGPDWVTQVLEDVAENNALRTECLRLLDSVYQATYWQLSERLSEFTPLLPDDDDDMAARTNALAHWSEGFLHGLVSAQHGDELKARLAAEPLADIIRDLLQITRAARTVIATPKATKQPMRKLSSTCAWPHSCVLRNSPIFATRHRKPMKSSEFEKRRRQLMRMVGSGGIAILPAAPVKMRSREVEYRYRQDSDFYYLTGFAEPHAVAVLVPERPAGEFLLFCRERDPDSELWDGMRAGPDGAVTDYLADDAFPIDDLDDILPGIMESCSRVYYTMGMYPDFDARVADWLNTLRGKLARGVHTPHEFVALDHLLHDMRLYKSRSEVSAMRRSARVAVDAHRRAMRAARPGLYEYQVEAEFRYEFRRHNAWASYSPIVGSGENSCVLHYVANDAVLHDGDLVLVDAGCELDYYASDITRTFPVSGRFSPEQRAVYEIVLEAQKAAIDKTVCGNHWNEPHDAAVRVITKGLKSLGLLQGTLKALLRDEAYKPYYMHRTGHWIGMDVHDVGDYKVGDEWRMLESGMATTVEPGIYINGNSRRRAFRNIGVRIEDDVVVTRKGPDVLSKGLPKDADAVEALVQSA